MQELKTRARARAGELARRFVARFFPERQLFLRSRGKVRFVSLSPQAQLVCAGGLALALGWVVFASGSLVVKNFVIAAKNDRLAEVDQAYRALSDDMSRVQRYFVATTREIEAKHRNLAAAVGHKAEIEQRLAEVSGRLNPDRAEALSPAPPAGATAGRLEGIDKRLANVSEAQRRLIASLQEKARAGVSDLELMIGVTGLDLERLLNSPGPESRSVGGPLIRIGQSQAAMLAEEDFENRLMELAGQLSRLSGLENALQSLPLIAPVDHYYISSPYGKRRDPVTKQWSMHSGIDLSGIRKATIRATAPGQVVFAGNNGPYGKMVEIDHGQGLRTRYGHLHRISVKVGEKVGFRQELGQMGSTGRATGPHVHYEIWFDGKPRNPGQFMKAGKHVLGKG